MGTEVRGFKDCWMFQFKIGNYIGLDEGSCGSGNGK